MRVPDSTESAPAPPGRISLKDRYGNVRAWALVDAEDFDRVVAMGRWTLSDQGYAKRSGRGIRNLLLSRFVMRLDHGDPLEVDHISRDTLDNRKSNLRIVTHQQNRQNTKGWDNASSQYRGVSWDKERGKWKAQGTVNGRNVLIGRFDRERDAYEARLAWEREHMPFSVQRD